MQTEIVDLGLPASSAAGAAVFTGRYGTWSVTVEAVGGGNVQIQVSNDPSNSPASSSWVNFGSALSAAGTVVSETPFRWVRGVVGSFSSGAVSAKLCGLAAAQGGFQHGP